MDREEMTSLDGGVPQQVIGGAAIGGQEQELRTLLLGAKPVESRCEAILGAAPDDEAGHSEKDTRRRSLVTE
jgi:hypothetical protein